MAEHHPLKWLGERVQELPRSASSALGRALDGDNGVRARASDATDALVDVLPVGPDSVELRMKRARSAAARATEAEAEALEAARDAKTKAERGSRHG